MTGSPNEKIALSKFLGDRGCQSVWAGALSLSLGLALSAGADPLGDGQQAFEARDFARADAVWQAAADEGSAEAMVRLGLLRDLGLGGPRDAAAALALYLKAARLGLAEAQFNAAVLLDSGDGVARDPRAAAGWYGRAAANGHVRARYNLGLILAAGDGVPRNADLARYWLEDVGGGLPAAADRLANLAPPPPGQRRLEPPIPLSAGLVPRDPARSGPIRAEMAWAGAPAARALPFRVEIARRDRPSDPARMVFSDDVPGSALRVDLAGTTGRLVWRVSRVGPAASRYAAMPWQVFDQAGDEGEAPSGLIRIQVSPGDAAASRFARDLIRVFDATGYWTEIVETAAPPDAGSAVSYAYDADAALARDIALSLPGLGAGSMSFVTDPQRSPGMVVLRLIGGPAS